MRDKFSVDVQSLIDAQDNPFVLIDNDYNIVAANRAYQLAYSVDAKAVLGGEC